MSVIITMGEYPEGISFGSKIFIPVYFHRIQAKSSEADLAQHLIKMNL